MDARQHYLDEFERTPRNAARRKAIERFAELGFPTGREEAWRFTDIAPLLELPFRSPRGAPAAAPTALAKGPLRDSQIAFVDGRYAPELSSARAGISIETLDDVPVDGHAFAALNAAFATEGVLARVRETASQPIHLLFLSSPRPEPFVTHPRVSVRLEAGAKASVVESYVGPTGVYFTNAVTDISLAEGAALDYTKVQRESKDAFHVAAIRVKQSPHSTFISHSISLGASMSRNDLDCVLDGEGADCTLNGLFEATGRQLVDHHTSIDHVKPHATSRELYKGILDGHARGVFDGRIVVRKDAQKTNAMQTNRNLLLSKDALVNTKPQLEIFANDVKCKHGATIGQLDRDVLFYLRSRGIGCEEARRLLIHAFASQIIDEVMEPVRAQLGGCLGLLGHP